MARAGITQALIYIGLVSGICADISYDFYQFLSHMTQSGGQSEYVLVWVLQEQ
jgi:hypothetical protein